LTKHCPLLAAAKLHRENPKYEDLCLKNCECLESRCAIWDSNGQSCGFVASPMGRRLAVQN
jgi:hypothetical protein